MLKKLRIHGADISYEDAEPYVDQGIDHLKLHLTDDQARAMFAQAKAGGEAKFDAINGHKFVLLFQKRNFDINIDQFILSAIKSSY